MGNRIPIAIAPALLALLALAGCSPAGPAAVPPVAPASQPQSITAFAASSGRQALESAAAAFEAKTGTKIFLRFGASGNLLSQMKIARSGDLFFPASPDFMQMATRDGVLDVSTEVRIAYLIPAILLRKGNPASIKGLADLARPGLKIAIADPRTVPAGRFAYEIMEYNHLLQDIARNVVTYGESHERIVSLVILRSVDAAITWDISFRQRPGELDAVYLKPNQVPRLSYMSGAVTRFSGHRETASRFLRFLTSAEGQDLLRQNGYYTSESQVRELAPTARLGGEYELPVDYRPLVK
ncbi:MAG: molybdate ABC transporter substrate-binding protein [Chloroflexi bacterium]|nr:molybdate ABC transporter substrate-binding protein [Chloroflexota bacterium]